MCKFTRIPMGLLNLSIMLQKFSQSGFLFFRKARRNWPIKIESKNIVFFFIIVFVLVTREFCRPKQFYLTQRNRLPILDISLCVPFLGLIWIQTEFRLIQIRWENSNYILFYHQILMKRNFICIQINPKMV